MNDIQQIKQEFIGKFVDKKKCSKSYYKDGLWDTLRCRIEPSLIPELIYDYLFNKKMNSYNLCEFYLYKSRQIQLKTNINYKNSKGMDSSCLLNWFQIKRKATSFDYSYNEIIKVITEYVNDVMITNKQNNNFFEKWNSFYERINCSNIMKEISEYNIENFRVIDRKIERTIDISMNKKLSFIYDISHEEVLEKIGYKGEKIVFSFLQMNYGKHNVKWISKDNKYSPYDFELLSNGRKIYIEVKSTTNVDYFNFFMSRNEYNVYLANMDHYWLIFVSNITNDKNYIPNIAIYKNPKIEVSTNKVGFEGDNIYITPFNYFC